MTLLDRPGGLDGIAGTVLMPDDAGFDEARQTFNGMLDKHPAAIVQCLSTEDVVTAVRAARAAGLPIARARRRAQRGRPLRRRRRARRRPALHARRSTSSRSVESPGPRAAPSGSTSTPRPSPTASRRPAGRSSTRGSRGLTLTGGIGYLMGTGGFTCDTLVGAEVVTRRRRGRARRRGRRSGAAVGAPRRRRQLRRRDRVRIPPPAAGRAAARPDRRADRPPPPGTRGGRGAGPRHARRAQHVRRSARRSTRHRITSRIRQTDPLVVAINFAFQGSAADAEAAIESLRELRALPGVTGGFRPATYPELQSRTGILPFGLRHYWKGHFLRELDDGGDRRGRHRGRGHAARPLVPAARGDHRAGPVASRRAARRSASAGRAGTRRRSAIWEDPADDEANIAWVRRTADGLEGRRRTAGPATATTPRPTSRRSGSGRPSATSAGTGCGR